MSDDLGKATPSPGQASPSPGQASPSPGQASPSPSPSPGQASPSPGLRAKTFGQWWDPDESFLVIDIEAVRRVGVAAYRSLGVSEEDADYLFGFNLDKAVQGDHARGLRLVPAIIESARAGRLDLTAPIEVVSDWPAAAVIDGGPRASGRLVCRRGMEVAIEKARANGVGWTSARASGEILTPYALAAARAGMVGLVIVQSVPNVAPLGGFGPLLGNAPIAVGVPAGEHDPVVLDMSLTESSASGVALAAADRSTLPEGVLLDEGGQPTTDARAFVHFDDEGGVRLGERGPRGTLTALGGGHKGYALVFIVGLLASALTDTSGPWDLFYDLPERGRYGTVLIALNPAVVGPPEAFRGFVDGFIETVKASPRAAGVAEILYPGERSQRLRRQRLERGEMAIARRDYEALVELAAAAGVATPGAHPLEEG